LLKEKEEKKNNGEISPKKKKKSNIANKDKDGQDASKLKRKREGMI